MLMSQPAPQPAAGQRGPIGTPTNTTQVFILALVTCGIYGVYWMYKQFEELKQHTGEGLGGAVGALLSLFWVGYFLLPGEVQKAYEAEGRQSPVEIIEALWLFVPIYGMYRYFNKVGGALNDYWIAKGAAPAA
jgi:uncharacterized protein DUF4234